MQIGVPTEVLLGERRVAATPDSVKRLIKQGFSVTVQAGAGAGAGISDADYTAAGAQTTDDVQEIWSADIVLKVNQPMASPSLGASEISLLSEKTTLVCIMDRDDALLAEIAETGASALALNGVPRITRAQKLDVLSSMANIAGYRAVVEASGAYSGFFGPQMTAAGKTPPARVLVIGAGVAGLAAIGAARALGAEVRAFDTRPEVKEQVQSMGAAFLELEFEEEGDGGGGYAKVMSEAFIAAEMALFREQCKEVDVIITTALIPGRRAPILVKEDMLQILKSGSVVVDLAAQNGGNCEGTVPHEVTVKHGVTIIGYTDLPSRMAPVSSLFFANNLVHLLSDMGKAEGFHIDAEDEVVRGALFVHAGEVLPPPPRKAPPPPPPEPEVVAEAAQTAPVVVDNLPERRLQGVLGLTAAVALCGIGMFAPQDFIQHFTVFALACVVGWQLIWNVSPALHTPLMSVTNAISGIILVGGLLQAGSGEMNTAAILGAVAILVATINIAGGFLVTHRMLQMFRK
ncbi:MAG: Re/Si-specific NAD(P)(+) transhydrogenase subunit alpha [Myxococcota bacterium]|nr:Re/Si-specific NAD(P)(+) transhydrogenase subunit alpha [Myxococcota bacterium]